MMKLNSEILLLWGALCVTTFPKCFAVENVDGNWSPWSNYGSNCSVTCGNGTQLRHRSCTNPTPEGTGQLCKDSSGTASQVESKKMSCTAETCVTGWEWEECENCTNGYSYNISMCGNEECTYIPREKYECRKWNKTTCPSPCEKKKCPEYGKCVDNSTTSEPGAYCQCTMGYVMSDDKKSCIRPPPTKPTRRPNPTLPADQKTVATAMSKSASSILIIFVGITLILFLVLRVFTTDRVIQMNMEISLISAHILLVLPASVTQDKLVCKIISILIHFFFTACFNFMMLEALHMYSMVAFVVKRDGMLTKLQNIMIGWGIAALVGIFCLCFEYDNYGGEYHCWLQMDTNLMLGELIPIFIITIVTLSLIEAAGAANFKPLKDIEEEELMSAQISQRTNLIILPFVIAHMLLGMVAEYEQNLPLYGTFSILNGVTGGLVFFLHCSNNKMVRGKLLSCCRSVTGKKK